MDFKQIIFELVAALLIVVRRINLLIFYPYRTMRTIAVNGDFYETSIIFFLVLFYFLLSYATRGNVWLGIIIFFIFILLFAVTVTFFYLLAKPFKNEINIMSFIFTFAYALIPTLFWFYTNLVLFIVLPPPRTMSILGKGFSIFFIAYSVSLLVWKLILVYLALRFSSRLGLYRIIYMFLLYTAVFIPLSLLLYYFKIFRIPFI